MIVGLKLADDAGIYKITDEIALVQTVDFFTPVADDPFVFGQIAAANALSDVYAMGGVPKTAMNIVCFPSKTMDLLILRKIIEGGLSKIKEAGVVLVGGHSVESKEIKYGLSVTGFVHPDRIFTKKNIKNGDSLILTKPIGSGIINTAVKGGIATEEDIKIVTKLMATLNKAAADVMNRFNIHACTDITGFGLIGHMSEMINETESGFEISASAVPVIPGAEYFAQTGFLPEGAYKNREFYKNMVEFMPDVDSVFSDIFFDPQTSGGLLISIDQNEADIFLADLIKNGVEMAAIIGKVTDSSKGKIIISR